MTRVRAVTDDADPFTNSRSRTGQVLPNCPLTRFIRLFPLAGVGDVRRFRQTLIS